jgi:hypothetical protein
MKQALRAQVWSLPHPPLLAATATGAMFGLAPQSARLRGSDRFNHFSQIPIDVIRRSAIASTVDTASADQMA